MESGFGQVLYIDDDGNKQTRKREQFLSFYLSYIRIYVCCTFNTKFRLYDENKFWFGWVGFFFQSSVSVLQFFTPSKPVQSPLS